MEKAKSQILEDKNKSKSFKREITFKGDTSEINHTIIDGSVIIHSGANHGIYGAGNISNLGGENESINYYGQDETVE